MSVGEWQRRGRAELQRTLSYSPKPVPLDLKVEKVIVRQGYETRRISFAGSPHYRIPANSFDAFGLHSMMDYSDVASLAAPDAAIFIQNCAQDRLFIREGMDRAVQKIERVYRELRRSSFFRFRYYDVPHQFNAEMQEDAFR